MYCKDKQNVYNNRGRILIEELIFIPLDQVYDFYTTIKSDKHIMNSTSYLLHKKVYRSKQSKRNRDNLYISKIY